MEKKCTLEEIQEIINKAGIRELSLNELECAAGGKPPMFKTHEEIDAAFDVLDTVVRVSTPDVALLVAQELGCCPDLDTYGNGNPFTEPRVTETMRNYQHRYLDARLNMTTDRIEIWNTSMQ